MRCFRPYPESRVVYTTSIHRLAQHGAKHPLYALPARTGGEPSEQLTSSSEGLVSSPDIFNLYFLYPRQMRCLILGNEGQLIYLEMVKSTWIPMQLTTSPTSLVYEAGSSDLDMWPRRSCKETWHALLLQGIGNFAL